ncbi:hypothetical protein ID867_06550 [Streptomyces parvulus]|nr:hypothetical protein [Streptomyces parvulus]
MSKGAVPSVRARVKISASRGGWASGAWASATGVMASQGGESWSPVPSSTGAYCPRRRASASASTVRSWAFTAGRSGRGTRSTASRPPASTPR